MATRQYIGARYVPLFYTDINGGNAWESGVEYEPLTIVTYLNQSYTSRKTVPIGVGNPSENPTYWVMTGAYNSQVEQYRQEVEEYREEIKDSFVTPEMYGAVGDGITDDYTAFTNMFNDNPSYVLLSPKSYKISDSITINSKCVINGNGATLIIPSTTQEGKIVFTIANEVHVYNLNAISTNDKPFLNGPDDVTGVLSSNRVLFHVTANNCTFENINTTNLHTTVNSRGTNQQHVKNLYVNNINATGVMFGIGVDRTDNAHISNCNIVIEPTGNWVCHSLYICQYVNDCFVNNYRGYYNGTKDPTILGLHASSAIGVGLINKNIHFDNCYFEQAGPGAASIIDSSACEDVYFNGCVFKTTSGNCGLTSVINNDCKNVNFNNCEIMCGGFGNPNNGIIMGRFQDTDFKFNGCNFKYNANSSIQNIFFRFGNAKFKNCNIEDAINTYTMHLCDKASVYTFDWTIEFEDCNVIANQLIAYALYDGAREHNVNVNLFKNIFTTKTQMNSPIILPTTVQSDTIIRAINNACRGYVTVPTTDRTDYIVRNFTSF